MPSTSNEISRVVPGAAASTTGLRAGDRIESVAGISVKSFSDLRLIVMMRPGHRVPLEYSRGGEVHETQVTLGTEEFVDEYGQKSRIGILGVEGAAEPMPVWQALPEATRYTVGLTRSMIDGIGQIISGQRSVKEIGGPLKIAQVAGQSANLGPLAFITLVALISINLGFINLLPVPMLDGGHLLFYSVEAVRRRPVSVQAQEWAFRGGLALLLVLFLFTTMNDLGSFGVWERLGRLIG
jgi:regulator of sigma E protease